MRFRRGLAVLALTGMPLAASVSAHRVDEYLQAAQVSIDRNRVGLDVYLTPGTAVVPAVLAAIDRSGDGRVSADEAHAYASAVVGRLSLELDGTPIPIVLQTYDYPSADALAAGVGSIRVRAAGMVERMSEGEHLLVLHNGFWTPESVYLANAMLPRDSAVAILGQERDGPQTRLAIRYRFDDVVPSWFGTPRGVWLTLGAVSIALVGFWYRRTITTTVRRREAC